MNIFIFFLSNIGDINPDKITPILNAIDIDGTVCLNPKIKMYGKTPRIMNERLSKNFSGITSDFGVPSESILMAK